MTCTQSQAARWAADHDGAEYETAQELRDSLERHHSPAEARDIFHLLWDEGYIQRDWQGYYVAA